jgi:dual-specificity kinase
MSTPQTLTQTHAPAPHASYNLGRQLISPTQRYLPPPRPSSNLSNGYYQNLPTRPPSNLSVNQQFAPPRAQHSLSTHPGHSSSRTDYAYGNGYPQAASHEDLRRTTSRASQHHRHLPDPAAISRAPPSAPYQMPPAQQYNASRPESSDQSRKRKDVDWVEYFGGQPPKEIITIHDDDSPEPAPSVQKLPPPTNDSSAAAQHVDKRRRVNGGADVPAYSEAPTPYSYSNGKSSDSLNPTTAPTSMASQVSGSSRIDNTQQTGQKRKRTTRTSETERKKQEVEHSGASGYLAEYGEYIPPPKQSKKQREVAVPQIRDVSLAVN